MKTMLLAGLACLAGLALSCNNNAHQPIPSENLIKSEKAKAPASSTEENKDLLKNQSDASGAVFSNEPPQLPQSPGKTRQQSPTPASVPADWEKKIVRNADMTMQVKDLRAASRQIGTATRLNGGFVAASNEQQLLNEIRVDMTIKVPRERFEELLENIQGSSDSLLQKEVTSEDLTEEYVDIKARIRAKEKVRERYYDFMKRANNIKEVLAVETDLRVLEEEIESATGRTNYIDHQSALSSIHLIYFQPLPITAIPEVKPGFVTLISENFNSGLSFLKEITLLLIAMWPLSAVVLFLVWIFRKQKKTKSVVLTAPANSA